MQLCQRQLKVPAVLPDNHENGIASAPPLDVFISYSRKDKHRLGQLIEQLKPMRREGLIADWHDCCIDAGDDWSTVLEQKLATADVYLMLVSPSFLASDYCCEIELRKAMERERSAGAKVIPILGRPCDWRETPIAQFQSLPKDGRSISQWPSIDLGWLEVTKGLRRVIRSMRDERSDAIPADQISPDWRDRLDRIDQTAAVKMLTSDMVRHGQPRCLAFCWYGGERDGVDVFHKRLESELQDATDQRSWAVRPEWPIVVSQNGLRSAVNKAFGCAADASAGDLAHAIRQHFRGGGDARRCVVYVNHTPIRSSKEIDPEQYLQYLTWWNQDVLPNLERHQFVVLGTSFVVKEPAPFRHAFDARVPKYPFDHNMLFRFLSVLASVEPEDLRTFFKLIGMHTAVDQEHQELAIQKILQDTEGDYSLVIRELEVLIEQGFPEFEKLQPTTTSDTSLPQNFGY